MNEKNSGINLIRRLILKIWELVHGVWLERNQARHGRDEMEQKEKKREQCLREIESWYDHRAVGNLLLAKADDKAIFYRSIEEHKRKEGNLAQVQTWLCTFGSALLQSKLGAALARRQADSGLHAQCSANLTVLEFRFECHRLAPQLLV